MGRNLLLLGNGGHAKSVLDSVLSMKVYDRVGIVDKEKCAPSDERVSYAGTDNDLQRLYSEGWTDAFVAVGSIGNTSVREKLYATLQEIGFIIPVITDATAIVSENTRIAEGTFIGKRAVINAGTTIGECAIINTGAIIEHDCRIGRFVHVSPGAILCGEVEVGDYAHIGAGAVSIQQVQIGERSLIGAGSVVTDHIPKMVKAYGNPCRVKE